MQEENINFEEIGKNGMKDAEQTTTSFKQPIRGIYKNLYAELETKCDPQNFMSPYEPDKVSKANELYSRLLETDEKDETRLKELRTQAMSELGIRFSTETLYKLLTNACDPRNFVGENYNKERLDLANRLYQTILENADDILKLEKIKIEAEEFVSMHEKRNMSSPNTRSKDEDEMWLLFSYVTVFVIMIIVILFAFILASSFNNP